MEDWVRVAVVILSPLVSGLVIWVWRLWESHSAHKLHVAETYIKKTEITERLSEQTLRINEVRDAVNRLTALVLEAVSGAKHRAQRRD